MTCAIVAFCINEMSCALIALSKRKKEKIKQDKEKEMSFLFLATGMVKVISLRIIVEKILSFFFVVNLRVT